MVLSPTARDKISFPCTNESIDSIIVGLDLSKDDNVLAVGGSGDQAFACLEHVNSVALVEINSSQREFIKNRLRLLEQGDKELFVWPYGNGTDNNDTFKQLRQVFEVNTHCGRKNSRNNYFLDGETFEKIRNNSTGLKLLGPSDIGDVIFNPSFNKGDNGECIINKVYLSNILNYTKKGYSGRFNTGDGIVRRLRDVLPNDGLIYVTESLMSIQGGYTNFPGIILDKMLTLESLRLQREDKGYRNWTLAVLRVKK